MKNPTSVRIQEETHEALRALQVLTGKPIGVLVNEALKEYVDRQARDEGLAETVKKGLRQRRQAYETIMTWAAERRAPQAGA